ncbi:MAG TPA: hypothetical protein VF941_12955 [Clostridia bacterium]
MNSIKSEFDFLKDISTSSTYPDGSIKDCILDKSVILDTPYGPLVPQYEHAGVRRKHTYSVSFFQNGIIQRIALHDQTEVETPIGRLPAELITFYDTGRIKRIFPLNGQITGYWSEDDEYSLAQEFTFNLPAGTIKTKVISVCFYENGSIQSLTLWPKEIISVKTPIGEQRVRIGLCLYPSGEVKSFEPASPTDIVTPIGTICAFDLSASGINGDVNSLNFTKDGKIKSLITSNTKITVKGANTLKTYSPTFARDINDTELYFEPLKIEFDNENVIFSGESKYKIKEFQFKIEPYSRKQHGGCSSCASCNQCSSGVQGI